MSPRVKDRLKLLGWAVVCVLCMFFGTLVFVHSASQLWQQVVIPAIRDAGKAARGEQ